MNKKEEKSPLTEAQRLVRVITSQGRAPRLAEHLPDAVREQLLALCDEQGMVSPTARVEFPKILREWSDANKATVEETEA